MGVSRGFRADWPGEANLGSHRWKQWEVRPQQERNGPELWEAPDAPPLLTQGQRSAEKLLHVPEVTHWLGKRQATSGGGGEVTGCLKRGTQLHALAPVKEIHLRAIGLEMEIYMDGFKEEDRVRQ